MSRPSQFFSESPAERSKWSASAFVLLVGLLVTPPGVVLEELLAGEQLKTVVIAFALSFIVGPLAILFSACVTTGLVHFWLLIVRARHAPIRDTFSCVSYTLAAAVFTVIPVAGSVIALLWQLPLLAVGLRHVHRTTAGRAAFAVVAGPGSLLLIPLILRTAVVEAFQIPSAGMLPTLEIGDHLFVSKLAYGPLVPFTKRRLFSRLPPNRGDVIVFEFPDPDPANPRQDFIKRAIAVEGDRLEVVDGHPIINGWRVPSCYAGMYEYDDEDGVRRRGEVHVEYLGEASYLTFYEAVVFSGGREGPYHVGRDEVWVLGDNRHNSADSRMWRGGQGAGVPLVNITGRAGIIWLTSDENGDLGWSRMFVDLTGRPSLPSLASPELASRIEECLSTRPPIAQTTPPKSEAGAGAH